MTVYVVKKHHGQWSVSVSDGAVVTFESYDEAVEIARHAAIIMAGQIIRSRDQRHDREQCPCAAA